MLPRPPVDRWLTWAHRIVHGGDRPATGERADRPEPPDLPERRRETAAVRRMLEGQLRRRAGAHREAIAAFAAAEKMLRRPADQGVPGAAWALAWCRLWWAHAEYSRGDFAAALQRYSDLLPAMTQLDDARGLVAVYRGLGNVAKYLGLYADAAEHYELSLRHAEASGDRIGRAMAEHNLGNVMLELEDFAGAEKHYRSAAVGFARTQRRDLLQHAWVNLAEAARASGRPEEALRRLARAEQIGRAAGATPGFEAERLIALGTCQRELGRLTSARESFRRAVALAARVREQHIEALALRALAELELACRRVTAARTIAERALRLSRHGKMDTELSGRLHEVAARAAHRQDDATGAARHFEEALGERKRLSQHLAQVRARSIALTHELNRARHEAELARLETARLEEALARVAARLEPVAATASEFALERVTADALAPLGLSRRESEVLLWLLRGKTNAEIAVILGCGPETVKTHLKRIFARLDVTNRAGAITHAVAFVAGKGVTHAHEPINHRRHRALVSTRESDPEGAGSCRDQQPAGRP